MDLRKVIANREVRQQRHARPYQNFREAADQCVAAARDIVECRVEERHLALLERSIVITYVTHIEVYFRDMLDAIFRQCAPDFFRQKLKQIHQNKYDIDDLIKIYEKQVHPLELVSSEMSFQNAEVIEKVFSKFLGHSLWSAAINTKIRVKDNPETVYAFEGEYLDGLKRIFELRHELVHNPRNTPHLSPTVLDDLENADGLMLAVDVVLCRMLSDNRDPFVESEIA